MKLPNIAPTELRVDTLKAWSKNPRKAEEKDLQDLRDKMKNRGQIDTLLVAEDGIVINGNHRLKVLQELGVEKVWAFVVKAPTNKEKLEYALDANGHVANFMREKLSDLLMEIPDFNMEGFSINMGTSMKLSEIDLKAPNLSLGGGEGGASGSSDKITFKFQTAGDQSYARDLLNKLKGSKGFDSDVEALMFMLEQTADNDD